MSDVPKLKKMVIKHHYPEEMAQLIKLYGMKNILNAILDHLKQQYEAHKEPYIKQLIDDLQMTIDNYDNRYSK